MYEIGTRQSGDNSKIRSQLRQDDTGQRGAVTPQKKLRSYLDCTCCLYN
jgi:hypothetical protein